jgi:hypothetical protein
MQAASAAFPRPAARRQAGNLEISIKNIAGNVRSSFRQNITLISALY